MHPPKILMADDDEHAVDLMKEAFERSAFSVELAWVNDGQQLLEYLESNGCCNEQCGKRPALIILDLNMPGVDGRCALKKLKANQSLRDIPVLVMSNSDIEEDVKQCYQEGVNTFIKKPDHFSDLLEVTQTIQKYWFRTAKLPD